MNQQSSPGASLRRGLLFGAVGIGVAALVLAGVLFFSGVLAKAPVSVARGPSGLEITNTSDAYLHDVRLTLENPRDHRILVRQARVATTIPPHETITVDWSEWLLSDPNPSSGFRVEVGCKGYNLPMEYHLLP